MSGELVPAILALLILSGCCCDPADIYEDNLDGQDPDVLLEVRASEGSPSPLTGVNAGPVSSRDGDLTAEYQSVGVSSVRTHDHYGPLDMSVMFPDLEHGDPLDPGDYDYSASDETFSAILAGGFTPYLRLGDSWNVVKGRVNAPRNASQREAWADAAVEVVRHFRALPRPSSLRRARPSPRHPARAWRRPPGDAPDLEILPRIEYVEIWNEPDNATNFWAYAERPEGAEEGVGYAVPIEELPAEDFFDLFCRTFKKLEAEFPGIKVGGPGLAPGSYRYGVELRDEGRWEESYVSRFLEYLDGEGVEPDFLSWHIYSDEPDDYRDAARFYQEALDSHDLPAESHLTEFNTSLEEDTSRTLGIGAAKLTAAWINLQKEGVKRAFLYRGSQGKATNSMGMFSSAAGHPRQAVAHAFDLWARAADFPGMREVRQTMVESPHSGIHALGFSDVVETAILLANTEPTAVNYNVIDSPETGEARGISHVYEITLMGELRDSELDGARGYTLQGHTVQLIIVPHELHVAVDPG